MARTKKTPSDKVAYQGFVNVSLTKDRKRAIKEFIGSDPDVLRWLDTLTGRGYKVSITWTEEPGFYSATAYQTSSSSDHAGWGTSARHSDLHVALGTLFYQIDVILSDEGWTDGNGLYEW